MDSISDFCQGESHKLSDKPCQDYAYAGSTENLSMAIVSDGHGGERYFRSQFGSKFLVEITKKSVRSFVDTIEDEGDSVFEGAGLTKYSKEEADASQEDSKPHKRLMWLFSSIINQWNVAIANHAAENDLDDWELQHVPENYRTEFLSKREDPTATFEKTYGCTLMAYVQTPKYWFAFHIGDGKLVTMRIVNEILVCEQPVPWDKRCFLNKTTSICDSNAIEEFRYCYQGDGNFPTAAFLGSDGLDDSFGDGEQLYNFYANLFKQIAKSGKSEAYNVLKRSLPKISQMASKDDMSVACVYDDSNFEHDFYTMVHYQKELLKQERDDLLLKNSTLRTKIDNFGPEVMLDDRSKINLEYARKDLEKVEQKWKKVNAKIRELEDEEIRFDRGLHPNKSQKPNRNEQSRNLGYIGKRRN